MSRGKEETTFLANLFSAEMYKRNQGRLVRRLTAIAVAGTLLIGCWVMSNTNAIVEAGRSVQLGVPAALAVLSLWFSFRLINYPRFANFLISVEAEMDKVSWADQSYLVRATGVVISAMFFLGAVLWTYDFLWFRLFSAIHILDAEALQGTEGMDGDVPDDGG
ncbi:MAG: preprotein translocase subunit SecE [Planctomycetota bacterium]|nr:MAG: preprotein translocase subunit SecE [Planctomycetota bacterium]REJ93092.1 MAG: preprotein translocase subunit SecE [Planctomycetota bacterium]REK30080.1 MAG: preprotein translocase subunit SecE [Planctomycetota bacterium]REK37678.1 MAG: preprotein translocase subunit SecE [Planctomycetota bacterium]